MTEAPEVGFDDLPLRTELHDALAAVGYKQPTPVQAAVIPQALREIDIIAQARTGTGKTAAFMLPALQMADPELKQPQTLVLAPTRELCRQVAEESKKLRGKLPIGIAAIYGGTEYNGQLKELANGAQVVVGCPGRVLDLLERGSIRADRIRTVILDEADQMLDIGFRLDLERILKRVPRERQTMLFSATMPPPIMRIAGRYMREPLHINLVLDEQAVRSIRQFYLSCTEDQKFETLLRLLVREKPRQALVFCQMKVSVRQVAAQLQQRIRAVMGMQGDLPQGQRNAVMADFRAGKIRVLVATDVVGRGIDVTGISHVINYDLPEDPEAYCHRVGRTGRMGRDGKSYSLVTPEQGGRLSDIERFMNKQLERDRVDGSVTFRPRTEAAVQESLAAVS